MAHGVERAILPDPEDYDAKLEAMTICQILELGIKQLHEDGGALYIRHKNNQSVLGYFVGDEYVGAERKQPFKERMATSVKEL
jgi:hypothetical protein